MKLRLTFALLLAASAFSANAATELTPEKADQLKPFKQITVRGEYNRMSEASEAVSKAADKQNAAAYYINNIGYHSKNDALWIVSAYLYTNDAEAVDPEEKSQETYRGLVSYNKSTAIRLEPFKRISIRGSFQTLSDMNQAVAKEAEKHDAYAFYIDQFYDTNGSNKQIIAYLYEKDAPERKVQIDNTIPYDSEAGQAALAKGGDLAGQVEDPTAKSTSLEKNRASRYTVTLDNDVKIEELNRATAAKMTPFESIKFRGNYNSLTALSHAAAKKAAAKGAKYYYISSMRDDKGNGNYTVYVDLFR